MIVPSAMMRGSSGVPRAEFACHFFWCRKAWNRWKLVSESTHATNAGVAGTRRKFLPEGTRAASDRAGMPPHARGWYFSLLMDLA